MTIHPTAIIGKDVKLGENVSIGPYCVLEGEISIGANTKLVSHVAIGGRTRIGESNQIFPFSSLGYAPQDLKYHGEKSELVIGDHNVIREHVTMNPGTEGGGMLTEVGSHCLFMVGAHVAHDCVVSDHVILANNATLGGHVTVGEHAIIGGLAAVHQFVRIGPHAIIGGLSAVVQDLIPYGSAVGDRAALNGLNLVGLKRRGFSRDAIHSLRGVYRLLFEDESGTLSERVQKAREQHGSLPEVAALLDFVDNKSSRALCLPRSSAPEALHAA